MNHGLAIIKEDWDIFKKNDVFQITAWLPFEEKIAIWVGGIRGCTVNWLTFDWSEEKFLEYFYVQLDGECCKLKNGGDCTYPGCKCGATT